MRHLCLLSFPRSLVVFDVNELLKGVHLQVHLCPQFPPDLLCLIPEVFVEVKFAESLIKFTVDIFEQSTSLDTDMIE